MEFLKTLVERDRDFADASLPQGLRELYDGDLRFRIPPRERPFVIGNFVSTLDGIVSYEIQGQASGSTISGADPADRFIMGLLRASADAVMVGARTVHDVSSESLWIPEYTYPDAKNLYSDYRVNMLRKPRYPLVVIVSGSGRLELGRAVFRTAEVRTVIITTPSGKDELARVGGTRLDSLETCVVDAVGGTITPLAILRLLHTQFGVRMLLHEGGPTLFGQFLAADAVDELFMTLSPQCAGRNLGSIRPGLVQGVEFTPELAPWFQLVSVKQRAEYLYLRYQRADGSPSVV